MDSRTGGNKAGKIAARQAVDAARRGVSKNTLKHIKNSKVFLGFFNSKHKD